MSPTNPKVEKFHFGWARLQNNFSSFPFLVVNDNNNNRNGGAQAPDFQIQQWFTYLYWETPLLMIILKGSKLQNDKPVPEMKTCFQNKTAHCLSSNLKTAAHWF